MFRQQLVTHQRVDAGHDRLRRWWNGYNETTHEITILSKLAETTQLHLPAI